MENSKLLCLFRGQLFDMAAASLNFHFALTRVAKKLSIFKHQNICQLQRTYTSKNHVILAIFFHYFCKTFCLGFNFFSKILRNTFVALKFSRLWKITSAVSKMADSKDVLNVSASVYEVLRLEEVNFVGRNLAQRKTQHFSFLFSYQHLKSMNKQCYCSGVQDIVCFEGKILEFNHLHKWFASGGNSHKYQKGFGTLVSV